MKPIVEFLKSTFLGGLLVLLPLLLSWALLAKAFDMIVKMAAPVVRLLPNSILMEAPRLKELAAVLCWSPHRSFSECCCARRFSGMP